MNSINKNKSSTNFIKSKLVDKGEYYMRKNLDGQRDSNSR